MSEARSGRLTLGKPEKAARSAAVVVSVKRKLSADSRRVWLICSPDNDGGVEGGGCDGKRCAEVSSCKFCIKNEDVVCDGAVGGRDEANSDAPEPVFTEDGGREWTKLSNPC